MFGLFGKIKAHPGQRDLLNRHLLKAAEALHMVDGCYVYIVSHDPNDSDSIWVTEIWKSQADHQASLSLDAIQALIQVGRPFIAEMTDRVEFIPLGGKGLPKSVE